VILVFQFLGLIRLLRRVICMEDWWHVLHHPYKHVLIPYHIESRAGRTIRHVICTCWSYADIVL
jgi:hypothetical protein